MSIIDNLQSMLTRGQDSALLRYGLANEYLKAGESAPAAEHLAAAVRQDPDIPPPGRSLARDSRPSVNMSRRSPPLIRESPPPSARAISGPPRRCGSFVSVPRRPWGTEPRPCRVGTATDETAARLAARHLGIDIHGRIGVLLRAMRRAECTAREVVRYVYAIRA